MNITIEKNWKELAKSTRIKSYVFSYFVKEEANYFDFYIQFDENKILSATNNYPHQDSFQKLLDAFLILIKNSSLSRLFTLEFREIEN